MSFLGNTGKQIVCVAVVSDLGLADFGAGDFRRAQDRRAQLAGLEEEKKEGQNCRKIIQIFI